MIISIDGKIAGYCCDGDHCWTSWSTREDIPIVYYDNGDEYHFCSEKCKESFIEDRLE